MLGILIGMIILTGMYFLTNIGSSNDSITAIDEQAIEKYLSEEMMNPNYGGEIFATYEILETDKNEDKNEGEIYLWALIEEYYKKGESIEMGSGMSVPVVLSVRLQHDDTLEIISHSLPADGSYYLEDIKEMFPKKIQKKILDYSSNHITGLMEKMENKVEEYY